MSLDQRLELLIQSSSNFDDILKQRSDLVFELSTDLVDGLLQWLDLLLSCSLFLLNLFIILCFDPGYCSLQFLFAVRDGFDCWLLLSSDLPGQFSTNSSGLRFQTSFNLLHLL